MSLVVGERENGEILLVDKPKGLSSFDVIRQLRPLYPKIKMGHAGTLDPFATGLLIIALGRKTKELESLLKLDKTYEVEIVLGVGTDTGDVTGKITSFKDSSFVSEKEIKDAVLDMKGEINLAVPLYSAVKVKGKRLYEYAREGRLVELPIKKMTVVNAHLVSLSEEDKQKIVQVVFEVKSGTYIRALSEGLGRRLGVPAMTRNLRRTKVGNFSIN